MASDSQGLPSVAVGYAEGDGLHLANADKRTIKFKDLAKQFERPLVTGPTPDSGQSRSDGHCDWRGGHVRGRSAAHVDLVEFIEVVVGKNGRRCQWLVESRARPRPFQNFRKRMLSIQESSWFVARAKACSRS